MVRFKRVRMEGSREKIECHGPKYMTTITWSDDKLYQIIKHLLLRVRLADLYMSGMV